MIQGEIEITYWEIMAGRTNTDEYYPVRRYAARPSRSALQSALSILAGDTYGMSQAAGKVLSGGRLNRYGLTYRLRKVTLPAIDNREAAE